MNPRNGDGRPNETNVTLSKLVDFSGLNIAGIVWDKVRTQLKKHSDTSLVQNSNILHFDYFQ